MIKYALSYIFEFEIWPQIGFSVPDQFHNTIFISIWIRVTFDSSLFMNQTFHTLKFQIHFATSPIFSRVYGIISIYNSFRSFRWIGCSFRICLENPENIDLYLPFEWPGKALTISCISFLTTGSGYIKCHDPLNLSERLTNNSNVSDLFGEI